MSDVVIRVENLWKQYRLGVVNHGTLKHDLQSWWARVRGTEDPNARLDAAMRQANGPTTPDPDASAAEAPDRFWALKDVSFDVKQGEVLGIIGRNGAGKSTLLKILSRVTTPTRGEIKIRGRVASLLEVGTGFHPELTGRENIFLNGAILGMSKVEIRGKLEEIVDFSGVEQFIDTPVKRYSSGMYVRLAFAVAAHLEPEILVVDEVLAVGDAEFQKKCMGKMEDVAGHGRTVLFVSHNMAAVQKICTSGLLLSFGSLAQKDRVPTVIGTYLEDKINDRLCWEASDEKIDSGKAVFISSVKLYGRNGFILESINCADQVTVAISFELRCKVKNLHLALALDDYNGTQIFATYPEDDGYVMPSAVGKYYYKVTFPDMVLLPQKYKIRVIIWEKLGVNSAYNDQIHFQVKDAPSFFNLVEDRYGLLALRCRWQIA